jgi:myxalamid-type polyketide synthase MxaB
MTGDATMNEAVDRSALMRSALRELRNLRAKVAGLEQNRGEPIAVVGLACRFPQAENAAVFWELLAEGRDAITEVPKERWDVDAYFDPDPETPGKMYSRWGGFIGDIESFSPSFFGIAPREASNMDPQQRLLLEIAWQALENAGAAPERLSNRQIGIFVGVGASDYSELSVKQGLGAIDPFNGTGSSHSVAAGRLSYFLGVRGPSLAVDTACSSSLAAVHLAVKSLREGESDIALAGGVNLMMSPDSLITLSKARMLSPDGRCKTFDASANGYVRGEGCGVLVLKRLSDAIADRDRIHALLRGSAVNHNGRSGGLTVPSGPAQEELLKQALDNAGLRPADVQFVEAHGTGTAVGDPIEVGALGNVHAGRSEPLLIGSVKSNVGHLEWAAGVCGLIKVILAMGHGQIPPSLHVRKLNPHLDWEKIPVKVVTSPAPWPEGRRIAGVSSFGFGGTNAHVIVEAPPAANAPVAPKTTDRPLHIFTASAKTPEALNELAAQYEALPGEMDIADICFSANTGRNHFEQRIGVIASSRAELHRGLRKAKPERVQPGRPRVAMLFTGQGSQYPGMARELFETQPIFRRVLQRCDAALRGELGLSLIEDVLYPADPSAPTQPIHETQYTQPALFALEYAVAELWESWGIRPDAVIGHSVGEYVAAARAGVFSLEDGLKLIAARGRLMQGLPRNGAMAAIRAPASIVEKYLAPYTDKVSFAAINAPEEVVISGDSESVAAVLAALSAVNIASQTLTVSHAFHSALMEPMLDEFEEIIRGVRLSPPRVEFISNVSGRRIPEEIVDPRYWRRHVREAVNFRAGIELLDGHDLFIEVGPHPVLIGLGRRCLSDSTALWLPSLRKGRADWRQMLESLASVYSRGAEIDWQAFDRDYQRKKVELPGYPFERQRFVLPKSPDIDSRPTSLRRLIDSVVDSALSQQTLLTTQLGASRYPFLLDHKIFGEVVAPAASYVAMLLNGAASLGHGRCHLEDVYFVAPLVLSETADRTVQTVIEAGHTFQIISFEPNAAQDGTIRHVTGRIAWDDGRVSDSDSLDEARKRCTSTLDLGWLTDGIEGITFGPCFRWIDAIWANGNSETLAHLRRPEAVLGADGYWIHPGLLDACFQSAEATLGDEAELPLPFAIKSLVAPSSDLGQGTEWWTHAWQVGEFTWNIRLFNSSGALIVAIDGFEARKVPRTAIQRSTDWLYRIDWRALPLPQSAHVASAGEWLIVDGRDGLGGALSERLRQIGSPVTLARTDELIPLFDAGNADYRNVVYLWGEVANVDPAGAAEQASIAALRVVQILAAAGFSARLWFVTEAAAAVTGSVIANTDSLAQASVPGFLRTLALEYPQARPSWFDLPAQPAASDLDDLIREITNDTEETQVAWRASQRYVARLFRHRPVRAPVPDGPVRLQLTQYGSPEFLRLAPMVRRTPGKGEVEIEVKAAALNFRDVLITLGLLKDYYEQVLNIQRPEEIRLGFDCAGIIAAVGEGVTKFKPGDEVMSTAVGGSAQFITLPETDVVQKPKCLTFGSASALPTVFFTAHYGLLRKAGLKRGERVLIHAASGGVGQAAVQLATMAGAEIYATASPGKWDVLRAQGVKHMMNSRTLDFSDEIMRLTKGEGVDVVLNCLTGDAIGKSFDVLGRAGRFVEIGKIGILTPEEAKALRPDAAYFSFDIDREIDKDPSLVHAILGDIVAWFDAGQLHALPQVTFDLGDYKSAYRYVQQTRHVGKVILDFEPATAPPVRADGGYIVTGGLGALGPGVAEVLARNGAKHILLAGRSAPSERARAAIARLEAAGIDVQIAAADVSDADDVARMFAQCVQPVRGIVHAAGVLDDGVVANQSPKRFARVMAPKVRGAWNLHMESLKHPIDMFVCFSSMASMMGAMGQINYASANGFLDGLAQYRRALGLNGLSINWGPWADAGMAANIEVTGQGVEKIAFEEGLKAFEEIVAKQVSGPAQVGALRVNWNALVKRQLDGQTPAYLSELVARSDAQPARAVQAEAEFIRRYNATPAPERLRLLESTIFAELARVLGLGANVNVPMTQPWAELGIDSVMIVELKIRLERILQLTLPPEKLARDTSTNSLALFVGGRLDQSLDDEMEHPAETASDHPVEDEREIQALLEQIPQMFLTATKQEGRRVMIDERWRCDLASCNYLGLDLHPEIMAAIPAAIAEWGVHPSWTRAVASPRIYDDLERALAEFVGAPATLVFPSISLLHMGVIPALAGNDGIIFKDTEAHHSMHEACLRAQCNGAQWFTFPHSDIGDLERKLSKCRSDQVKLIATDGVYSMGSSHPPLAEYARLAKKYNAILYVDDAHGFGVIGERPDAALPYGYRGNGMVRHLGLDYIKDRIIYVAGMSKSFSSYAAFVTCFDENMKIELQKTGPYVFSGPTCTASLASALAGLKVNAREGDERRREIYRLTEKFIEAVKDIGFEVENGGLFPIVGVVIGGVADLVTACKLLWEHDIVITPAFYPAVPIDRNLVRVSITAANTNAEIDRTIVALKAAWSRLHTNDTASKPARNKVLAEASTS